MDELQWMPNMLGGVGDEARSPSENQTRLLLTYNIMIQHDIAKMSYKIQNSAFGNESSEATNQWSAAMFPLAEQLILLQQNLLIDIAAHDLVQNVKAAYAGIFDLLWDWRKWIKNNLLKALLSTKDLGLGGGQSNVHCRWAWAAAQTGDSEGPMAKQNMQHQWH
eukprot:s332_g14.t1